VDKAPETLVTYHNNIRNLIYCQKIIVTNNYLQSKRLITQTSAERLHGIEPVHSPFTLTRNLQHPNLNQDCRKYKYLFLNLYIYINLGKNKSL